MKELICPNCHKAFTVDEADYASIVNQVKNVEFNAEIDRRIAELHDRHKAEEQLAAAKAEKARQGVADSKIPKVKGAKKSKVSKSSITLKWTKLTSKQLKKSKATKYEIWACPNKKFASADTKMKTVSKSKSSGKISGLKKKTNYYVKVRAIRYANGVKYVGAWSSVKKIKTK
jgi:hypothetical protein